MHYRQPENHTDAGIQAQTHQSARKVRLPLSGDKLLRSEAQARHCKVFGLLWILDQMEASGRIETNMLHEGLSRIWSHPRRRLPKVDVMERLARWAPG